MSQTTPDAVSTGGTDVPGSESGIDVHSTAGKLADLKRRVAEVAHAGSERAVEKHIGAVFAKLGLVDERAVSRRVSAVLAYLEAIGAGRPVRGHVRRRDAADPR